MSLILGGCKAQSNLTITLLDQASGTVDFSIELDEPAASVLRSDSFNSSTLSQIFQTKELEDAGFNVDVLDNKNGDPSNIEMKAKFENKKQLSNILSYFAPKEVLNADMISKRTFFREDTTLSVQMDISKLRKHYLESEGVKKAILDSGIEFSEFEELINEAMSSTKLTLKLVSDSKVEKVEISGSKTSKESLRLSSSPIRTRFLLNMGFAVLFAVAGIVILWRIRRTPKLLSSKTKEMNE